MKTFKKLLFVLVPFLVVGCGPTKNEENQTGEKDPIINNNDDDPSKGGENPVDNPVDDNPVEDNEPWYYDDSTHFHKVVIDGIECITKSVSHTLTYDIVDSSTIENEEFKKFDKVKIKKCTVCDYSSMEGIETDYPVSSKIPELRFTTDQGTSFATTARMDDIDRPEVIGTYSLTNCDSKYGFENVAGNMKVRGNQTANWDKKGFRIKFDEKRNVLGLNDGKKFRKWVLFADAKDTALIRTALGLYLSDKICKDDGIFISDFTPVNVYLNDTYWGYYYLAEQKEVKAGRINLPEPTEGYEGTDIGYCFELDYYATNEAKKTDGDPTFTVNYKPSTVAHGLKQSEGIANFYSSIGIVKTYTMNSDITNETTQIPFIKKKVEDSFQILYETAMNKKAKMIDSNGQVVDSTETDLKKNLENYFDLNTWADGYLVNEIAATPDVGYSSFYMSYNNTINGDKKLRFENPWDFDSNFGNRKGFIVNGDDLYLRRCANQWLNLLSKIDFFMDIVKEKWNKLRDDCVIEKSIDMMKTYFESYDEEYQKNFARWPTLHNDIINELRDPFKNTAQYKKAEQETINWLCKRTDFLETNFGQNRPYINPDVYNGGSGPVKKDYTEFKSKASKTRLEAEGATLGGGAKVKTNNEENISEHSYVGELPNNVGSTVTFTINSSKDCSALLSVGLSSRTDGDHTLDDFFNMTLNGTPISFDSIIPQGNGKDFHCWTTIDAGMINLKKGQNTLVFTSTTGSTNFDYIDVYIPN